MLAKSSTYVTLLASPGLMNIMAHNHIGQDVALYLQVDDSGDWSSAFGLLLLLAH